MSKKNIFTATDQKQLFALLAKLIAANTANPPGNEFRVAKICETFLRSSKIKSQKYEGKIGRMNLLWSLGSGEKEILIAAHADTVPAGDGWRTDPFKLVRQNGRLIGRGVVDNKGVLAGLLLATKLLAPFVPQFKTKITFAALADEERGNALGIKYLLAQKIIRPDYALIPDSCGENRFLAITEKGVLHLKIKAFGQQGHGSLPESGVNAFYVLQDFLNFARTLPQKFPARDSLLGGLTVNVGAVRVGSSANIIPGEANALVDFRLPPQIQITKVLRELKTVARRISQLWRAKPFQIEVLATQPASATDKNHPLIRAALRAHTQIVGKKITVGGLPAFTFAGVLRAHGVPAVSCGPGKLSECHRANESLPERQLVDFVKILVELLTDLACPKN